MPEQEQMPVIREQIVKRRRGSKKLLWLLLFFFIVVLAVVFFQSSLSKISTIELRGNHYLSRDQALKAANMAVGDSFFGVASGTIENRIKATRIVENVHATKHFPGVVTIEIEEYKPVAYQLTERGEPQLLLANGEAVPALSEDTVIDKPILSGWTDPQLKAKLCAVLADIPEEQMSDVSEIKPDPSISYPDKIKLFTRSQYEVSTTVSYLPDKILYLDDYIYDLKQKNINSGELILLEADNHTPFSQENSQKKEDSNSSKETTQ